MRYLNFDPRQPRVFAWQSLFCLVAGTVLIFVALDGFIDHGIGTGLMLFILGGSGCVFGGRWDREPGLWMLGALVIVLLVPLYSLIVTAIIVEVLAGRQNALADSIDCMIFTSLTATELRLLITVTRLNWRYSRDLRTGRQ